MLESLQREELEYQKLSPEEQQSRGILGRLVGIVADFLTPTRNGRHYSEELWEKTFEDPIMKERIENGVCFGELGHPLDREETDMEKIAVVMPEVPKKNNDGKLTAVFDILDTPNGRILKTLCEYGSTLGVSSRGSGDTFIGRDGNEEVDPDSYTCQGFDIVLIPAVKSARLQYVTESLNNRKSLRESLQDTISKASEEEKKVMEETLDDLGIDLNESEEVEGVDHTNNLHYTHHKDSHGEYDYYDLGYIDKTRCSATYYYTWRTGSNFEEGFCEVRTIHPYNDAEYHWAKGDEEGENWRIILDGKAVENFKSKPMDFISVAKHLIELDKNSEISPIMVHEELNADDIENSTSSLDIDEVSDDKAVASDEVIFEELQKVLKQKSKLEQKVIDLNEKLSVCYAKDEKANNKIAELKKQVNKLTESSNQSKALKMKVDKLEENLNLKEQELEKLNRRVTTNVNARKALTEDVNDKKSLIESLNEKLKVSSNEVEALREQIADLTKDLQLNKNSYSRKLEKSNQLVENYKKITSNVVNRYIDSQALKLGISSNEIKNKLPESYNIDDIDAICEDLQSYKLSINKLPFSTMQFNENMKLNARTSTKNSILPKGSEDDFVDEQLLGLLEPK